MDIKQLDKDYIANTYARFDLVASRGDGRNITDAEGKTFIDLGSGIGVNIFGTADPLWVEAVTAQLNKLQHISNHFYSQPQTELATLLCERTGMKKVFFSNSGAEANECAIKCARKYSHDKYDDGRAAIVTLEKSFHGRSMAALSATGQEAMHTDFYPFLPGFIHVPANDFDAMLDAINETVCAVMIELVQGEGGVFVLDKDYVEKIAQMCAERDILLIIDEVQTGNGRTGSLYAFMQYGVTPDIVSTAKGLGGGLPIGATMFAEKTADTLTAGTHGTTFGGNPVCAAGAVSIISRIDDALLSDVRRKGELIRRELEGTPGVKSISGLGLMLGIEIEKDAREVVERCLERGVITLTAKAKLRLLPPLNIADNELLYALKIIKEVLAE